MFRFSSWFVIVCLLLSLVGCGSSGGGSVATNVVPTGDAVVRGKVVGEVIANIPVYLIEPNAVPAAVNSSLRANIAGTWYATTTDESGNFTFTSVVEGDYNLIAQQDRYHSAVLKSIQVLRAATTDLTLTLTATGDISGKISLPIGMNLAGIFVFIPGTSFVGTTGADGSFIINGIPVGTYQLSFQGQSIQNKSLSNVAVVAGQASSAGTAIVIEPLEGATINLRIVSPSPGTIFYPEDLNEIRVEATDDKYGIDRVYLFAENLTMASMNALFRFPFISSTSVNSRVTYGLNGVVVEAGGDVLEYTGLAIYSDLHNYQVPWLSGPRKVKISAYNADGKTRDKELLVFCASPKPGFSSDTPRYSYKKSSGLNCSLVFIAAKENVSPKLIFTGKFAEYTAGMASATLLSNLAGSEEQLVSASEFQSSWYQFGQLAFNKKLALAAKASEGTISSKWSYEETRYASPSIIIIETPAKPYAPTVSLASETSTELVISVTPPADWEADSFVLEYSNTTNTASQTVILQVDSPKFTLTNRLSGANYYFRAKAVYGGIESDYSQTRIVNGTIALNTTVTGLIVAATKIRLVNYGGLASCNLKATSGVDFAFVKSATESSADSTVLLYSGFSFNTLANFSTIKFNVFLPAGTRVEVINIDNGSVVAYADL